MSIHSIGGDSRGSSIRTSVIALTAMTVTTFTENGIAEAADRRIRTQIDAIDVLPEKQTLLQLYVTVREAAKELARHRDILLIDVRDGADIHRTGIASAVTRHIPIYVDLPEVQEEAGAMPATKRINPRFVSRLDRLLQRRRRSRKATIFVMCTAGMFSARAADLLAENGFKNVYSILEGYEGERTAEGPRTKNGWRNSGLPWTAKPRRSQVAINF